MATRHLALEPFRLRVVAVGLGVAISLGACGGMQPDVAATEAQRATGGEASAKDSVRDQREVLTPWQIITGGRQVTRLDAAGFPVPGTLEGFVNLISPSSVAVRGADVYIADSGARKLYRYDSTLQTLSVVPDFRAMQWTRLQAGIDGSLFALDAGSSTITHFTRVGKPLQTLTDPLSTARLTEFAVDESLGRIIASDQMNRRLVELHVLGRAARAIQPTDPLALSAIALAGRSIYGLDLECSCVVVMDDDGRIRERIGQGALVQPRALAIDRDGQIFVADYVDRTLKVFYRGELIATYDAKVLGVMEISALAADNGVLYIADAPGARVAALRIHPAVEKK